jgi:alpha-beta hydrolase superfamily lysophospholipase
VPKITIKLLKWTGILLATVVLTILVGRAIYSQRGAPLKLWHTYVPHDIEAAQIEATEWPGYLAAEGALFAEVRAQVTDKLPQEDRVPSNRYFDGSPLYPPHFKTDWNRSYVMEPDRKPAGVVVLLHGLTDSPYSLRHIARRYRKDGYLAVAIRLPGHGTVPAGLTEVHWQDWMAATRLAVREAKRRVGPGKPLHLVGFSNGGALALKYALDALEDPALPRPDRVILIAPMVGVTTWARFAGALGWPAVFPAFAKAAWLSVTPEFNPFKYNSFPVNGARQSSLLTRVLQTQVARLAGAGRLGELAPVLTFQSVVDFTVSTPAVVSGLYAHLPANGSELVIFDLNRNAKLGPLVRPNVETALDRLLPAPPRRYGTTIITNAGPDSAQMVERSVAADATTEEVRPLDLAYPRQVYSMSHVSLPFPVTDALYGMEPSAEEDFGINLGALAPRGEVGVLIVPLDSLLRVMSNPFFPYVQQRIDEIVGIGPRGRGDASPAKASGDSGPH